MICPSLPTQAPYFPAGCARVWSLIPKAPFATDVQESSRKPGAGGNPCITLLLKCVSTPQPLNSTVNHSEPCVLAYTFWTTSRQLLHLDQIVAAVSSTCEWVGDIENFLP